ncbi:hypothetical protein B0H21DRAFT_220625 [Amylocystis lapponica]|nr:hypothetical protein B0H21DRAFT_220625 [Amylocystis lapponica]
MQRFLNNYDAIYEVFQHLSHSNALDSDRLNRQVLARAARVCRAFSAPALDVLWREPENLLSLFRVLPSLERKDGTRDSAYFLSSIPSLHNIMRFQDYARRVRTTSHFSDGRSLDPSVFFTVAHANGGDTLLPSLQTLTWRQSYPFDNTLMTLASPSLHCLRIHVTGLSITASREPQTEQNFKQFLHDVFSQAPYLQELWIHGVFSKSLTPVTELRHLQSLAVGGTIDLGVFRAISVMDNLIELNITVDFTDLDQRTPDERPNGFSALQALNICGSSSHLERAVSIISSSHLHSVTIRTLWEEDRASHVGFLPAICSKWSLSLSHIALTVLFDMPPLDHAPSQLTMDYLRPLLTSHRLCTLTFESNYALSIMDRDVLDMAYAWPTLEILTVRTFSTIGSNGHAPECAVPSFRSIIELARHCPNLHRLSLSATLDSQALLSSRSQPTTLVSHSMRSLNFEQIMLSVASSQVVQLADYLLSIFPNLDLDGNSVSYHAYHAPQQRLVELRAAFRARRDGTALPGFFSRVLSFLP